MGACARNMKSDPAEIKPAQCCIKLVFHLTYTMMHGSTKLKFNNGLQWSLGRSAFKIRDSIEWPSLISPCAGIFSGHHHPHNFYSTSQVCTTSVLLNSPWRRSKYRILQLMTVISVDVYSRERLWRSPWWRDGKSGHKIFMTNNRCVQVKNLLGRCVVVSKICVLLP